MRAFLSSIVFDELVIGFASWKVLCGIYLVSWIYLNSVVGIIRAIPPSAVVSFTLVSSYFWIRILLFLRYYVQKGLYIFFLHLIRVLSVFTVLFLWLVFTYILLVYGLNYTGISIESEILKWLNLQ